MKFNVVRLYADGVRLPRDVILAAPPLVGQLTISDWPEGNASKRPLKQAQLKTLAATLAYDLTQPLFDPIILRMTKEGFVLRGWEFKNGGEMVQEWWIRATGDLPDSRR